MEETHFVEGSRASWDRLASAVEEARRAGVERLSVPRLRVMHDDYRRAAADLAYSQTHYPLSETTAYLNALVSRAHGELYGARPNRARTFWRFLSQGYPMLVREHWRAMALSAVLLFGSAALAYLLAFMDYGLARALVPADFQQTLVEVSEGGGDSLSSAETVEQLGPALATFITANNIQVSFLAFAGGMTAGVVTVWALVRNGLLLGALGGMWGAAGLDVQFWGLIVPHGALELLAITIAGGSGLVLARALVLPGDSPRMDELRRVAPDAVRIVLGTIPFFIVAGLIEGFFTLSALDAGVKIAVGFGVFGIAMLYLLLPGRRATAA